MILHTPNDADDNSTPIHEYRPSNKIISEFISQPHEIPSTAKNSVPITDNFKILLSLSNLFTSL